MSEISTVTSSLSQLSQENDGFWVGDEKTVSLTNTSLNVENSTVHIGNVIHHHHILDDRNLPNNHEDYPQKPKDTKSYANKYEIIFAKKRYCTVAILILATTIVGILVLLYITQTFSPSKKADPKEDDKDEPFDPKPSHSFGNLSKLANCKIIEEEDWGLKRNLGDIELKHPIPHIIISHSVTPFCNSTKACKSRIKQMQEYHISIGSPDIGYNFIIGGDGNIYVGRGWNARNFHLGNHSIGINFVGNYFRDELTPQMIECAKGIMDFGVKSKMLEEEYVIVCQNQTNSNVLSPGPNAYAVVKTWPHFLEGPVSRSYLYGVPFV